MAQVFKVGPTDWIRLDMIESITVSEKAFLNDDSIWEPRLIVTYIITGRQVFISTEQALASGHSDLNHMADAICSAIDAHCCLNCNGVD